MCHEPDVVYTSFLASHDGRFIILSNPSAARLEPLDRAAYP